MIPRVSGLQTFSVLLLAIGVMWYRSQQVPPYSHIPSESLEDQYDYIVVGGGSAGSVVAARLAEDAASKVLLLEAGGSFAERESFFVPIRWFEAFGTEYDWGYFSEPQRHGHLNMKEQRLYLPRGKVLGGTGMLNGLAYTRGSPNDFDIWEKNGCQGWSYEKVLPYFLKAEHIQIPELKSSKFHASGGPMAVSYAHETPLTSAYVKAGNELGYNSTDYNGAQIDGVSPVQVNIRNGVRSSSSIEYLGMKTRNNLHISLRSIAVKLDIQNKKSVGVFFIKNGRKKYIKALKEIIVCAGAIDSPKLLLLSGIGPKDHLSDVGIPVVADLPVGQSLLDHPAVILHSKINKPYSYTLDNTVNWWSFVQYWFGVGPVSATGLGGLAFLHFDLNVKTKNKPDVEFELINMLLNNQLLNFKDAIAEEFFVNDVHAHGITTLVMPTHLHSKGTVKLKSNDPFDDPRIDNNALSDTRDLKDFVSAIRVWEQFMETKAMRDLGVDIGAMKMSFCSEHEFRTDAYWECFTRHMMFSMFHLSGTCKMGPASDPTSVVDPELRVKGLTGLRVADASIFPTLPSANPNAPVVMVAEKAADLVRRSNS